jgi:serine/threonine protein kinase
MQMFVVGHQEEDLMNYESVELIDRGAFGNVHLVRKKSAGGPHYREEFYALKVTRKLQDNIELQVLRETVGHPYLVQLVSFFETEVCSSYLNVSVFRQLLILSHSSSLINVLM